MNDIKRKSSSKLLLFVLSSGLFSPLGFTCFAKTALAEHKVSENRSAESKLSKKELVAFLLDYQNALSSQNEATQASREAFLKIHTQWPLHVESMIYDMETKKQTNEIISVTELLKQKELLLFTEELLSMLKTVAPEQMKVGVQKCDDLKTQHIPNFQKGASAFTIKKNQATFSFLVEPCAAETHIGVWFIQKTSEGLILENKMVNRFIAKH